MTIAASPQTSTQSQVHYKTVRVNDVDIFYREAGSQAAPVVLLLHGFPTSSNMFRNLIPRLAGSFRVIAPDYPGYGQSSMPDHKAFEFTFENLARVVDGFVGSLGLKKYSMYVMDYGAPIGYRLALLHPERISGLVIQNGNAYEEGLLKFWDPIKQYWRDPTQENRRALTFLVTPEATKWQYQNGVADPSLLDPTTWTLDQALLDRPGNGEIQLDLILDYGTNVPLYPEFQAFFRQYQPPTLVMWGKNDLIFPPEGAHPYKRDLPQEELQLLDIGLFAVEPRVEEIGERIEAFLSSR